MYDEDVADEPAATEEADALVAAMPVVPEFNPAELAPAATVLVEEAFEG